MKNDPEVDVEDLEPVSDCCDAPMTGAMIDLSICPQCKEWTEVVYIADEE